MLFRNQQLLQAAVRQIQLLGSGRTKTDLEGRVRNLETAAIISAQTETDTPHQSVNILRNGDVAHSVRTYNLAPPALDDSLNKEAAFWFSHGAVAPNQAMNTIDGRTNLANDTLKTTGHLTYSALRCRWDRTIGAAELRAESTIDAPLAQPIFRSAFIAHLVIGRIALSNKNVAVPANAHLFAGFWAKQAGVWDWVKAANVISFSAQTSNPQAKEYRYRLHVKTDRGYQFLSNEVVVLNAPNSLGGGNYVQLSWAFIPNAGILSYDIYRFEPSSGQYVLLESVESGSNTFQDVGVFEKVVVGYPTGDFDRAVAYSATADKVLMNLARNGVSSSWDTIAFELHLPTSFNLGTLESNLFVRLGIKGLVNNKFDLRVDNLVTVNGNVQVTSADGVFVAGHIGLTFRLYNPLDLTTLITGTITNHIDANTLVLSIPPTFNSGEAVLVIEGGGPDHGIFCDLFHLSTSRGAIYAPHPEDYSAARPQPPASMPNGSTQGGTGSPTGGDGFPSCLWAQEFVWCRYGDKVEKVTAEDLRELDLVVTEGERVSQVLKKRVGIADVYEVLTENGLRERCTMTEYLITSGSDEHGRRLSDLNVGDTILTMKRGVLEESCIKSIILFKARQKVITLTLSASPLFVAGDHLPNSKIKRILKFLADKIRLRPSGIVNHNRKDDREIITL